MNGGKITILYHVIYHVNKNGCINNGGKMTRQWLDFIEVLKFLTG